MWAGVSKAGSPAPKPITSLPCSRRRAARAVTARVGEGLTRWTRRATGKVTEFPAFRLRLGSPAILRDCVRPGHREYIRVDRMEFKLTADYTPAGDQPEAIEKLVEGLASGLAHQTLLGVTGSGKTFSIANVIQQVQRSTLVLAHNKTLAAQLYGEFREFFPHNAVEYFVSYYDYYQPEAYVPSSDTYIEKDSSINEHIEQMRLSATKALLERSDVIIVATVSSIYGLGDPATYLAMVLHLVRGERMDQRRLLRRLADMQYTRNEVDLTQGTYRVRGDVIDIFPAEAEREAVRVELFDETIDSLSLFDPLTGAISRKVPRFTVYPGTHYVTPRERVIGAVDQVREDLGARLKDLGDNGKLVGAQRLEQRTLFDMEMMKEVGYCAGIENYS